MQPGDPPYSTKCGTVAFVAPEVLQRSAGLSADLRSAGVLIYQLLSGTLPFTDSSGEALMTSEVFSAIQSKTPSFDGDEWAGVPDEAVDLVRSLLTKDPSARPSARQALQCDWFCSSGLGLGPNMDGCAADYGDGGGTDKLDGTVVARLQRFATTGALRRAVLTRVAAQMDERRLAHSGDLRALFSELDRGGTGGIRPEDLEAGLLERGYTLTTEEVRELFEAVDVDRSGAISLDEWLAALTEWHTLEATTEWGDWARRAFSAMHDRAAGEEGGSSGDSDSAVALSIDTIADECCGIEWDGAGLVCKQALKDTLKASEPVAGGGLTEEAFVRLCESDADDDLALYESRYFAADDASDE